jgi:hypothetical protein
MFILVSLRKVTLKQADVVYGVTMQREGLSEMIANFDVSRISDEDERRAVEEAQKRVEEQLGGTAAEEPPEEEMRRAVEEETRRVSSRRPGAPGSGSVEEVVPRKRGGFPKKAKADGNGKKEGGDDAPEVTLAANPEGST